jgi:hypothetical protein
MGCLYLLLALAGGVLLGCARRVAAPVPPRAPAEDPAAFAVVVRPAEARLFFPVSVRRDWNWPRTAPAPGATARFSWGVTVMNGDVAFAVTYADR